MASVLKEINSFIFGKDLQEREIQKSFKHFKSNLNDGCRILEIGCGKGEAMRKIIDYLERKNISPGKIVVSDLCFKDLRFAEKNLKEEKKFIKKISFLREDATKLSFPNNYFDVVFGFSVLHHIKNWRLAIKEISRVLKKGGKYVMAEHTKEFFFSVPLFDKLDGATGFFSEKDLRQELINSKLSPVFWGYRGFYKSFLKGSLRIVVQKIGDN